MDALAKPVVNRVREFVDVLWTAVSNVAGGHPARNVHPLEEIQSGFKVVQLATNFTAIAGTMLSPLVDPGIPLRSIFNDIFPIFLAKRGIFRTKHLGSDITWLKQVVAVFLDDILSKFRKKLRLVISDWPCGYGPWSQNVKGKKVAAWEFLVSFVEEKTEICIPLTGPW